MMLSVSQVLDNERDQIIDIQLPAKDNPCHGPAHGTPPISLLKCALEQGLLLFALPKGRVLLQIIHHLLFLVCKEIPFAIIHALYRSAAVLVYRISCVRVASQ
jgi:hypothetical protein